MNLFCARHGESSYNAVGRIQGQLDVPLSEIGVRQSQALARAVQGLGIQAIYASPLQRAYQTAVPVAEALGLDIITDDRLKEIHAGIFQDLRWDEIDEKHPEEAELWRSQDPDFIIPTGESRRQLMRRGGEVFEAIRDAGHEKALVVAHGGLLTAAFKQLVGVPAERNPFSLYNCSLNLCTWEGEFKLRILNQVDHLRTAEGNLVGHMGDL